MTHRRSLAVALAAALAVLLPGSIRAQGIPPVRREIRGRDFRKDGVWRRQARAVRANRARLLARRRFAALNAPLLGGGGAPLSAGAPLAGSAAVSGVLRVPALLFKYKNTPASTLRNASQYNQVLFAASPTGASAGRPYTYRSFYEQLSSGLVSIQGNSYGYAALDSNEIAYAGYPPCVENPPDYTCNGQFSLDAEARMQNGLRQTLRKLDGQIDWTLYDSDGDGYVDLVVFIHPTIGGECGGAANNHLLSHRSALSSDYITHSVNSQGKRVRVADYVLEGGVGGADLCDSTHIMPISAVAHETGHGFGLPDLYDVYYVNAGVGVYSLMSWGVYASPLSPARMDAWSLNELGWVTVVPLPTAGTYSFGPAPTSDTAFFVPVAAPNPDGEYFLLENRQAVRSDSAMIKYLCRVSYPSATPPPSCGGGLLVWHVDSAQIANGLPTNTVNSGPVHGVALVQGDGLGNLDVNLSGCLGPTVGCWDYGDAADPYPGEAGNLAFTATSVPAAVRNSDGKSAGLALDQITRLAPNGAMSFRVVYPVWVVRAQVDTATVIQFDGIAYHVFRGVLAQGSTHTVGVADTQYTAGGRTRQVFLSWSDGGALSHPYMAGAAPETLTVTLARSHRLDYGGTSGGSVAADTAGTPVASGSFFAEGTAVTLTATPGAQPFVSWIGDTVSKNAQITLPLGRPYSVRAAFLAPLTTAAVVSQLLTHTGLTPQDTLDLDQLGNNNGRFDVGDFLAWVQATGAPLTAPQRALAGAPRLKPNGVAR